MILYINTFITDKRLSPHFKWERGTLPLDNRLDIFKYSLASFAAIDCWSKVIVNVKLDSNYEIRTRELSEYFYELFPNGNANLSFNRNEHQLEWQDQIERLIIPERDNIVWFCCNDDHIFLDYNLDWLHEILTAMQLDESPYKSLYYSHWPELLQIAERQGASFHGKFVKFKWNSNDSIQLINKDLLKAMWFTESYGDKLVPRPDFHTQVKVPDATFYVPLREMCRHYDGYNHVGISMANCPPLVIPPGFFDKDIKIAYGYHGHNRPGWVNIHPEKCDYTAVNQYGTDYKWVLEDIPLFWRSRISQVDKNKDTNEISNVTCRNSGQLGLATADKRFPAPKDFRWITAGMRT